jgi:hypothetical protein
MSTITLQSIAAPRPLRFQRWRTVLLLGWIAVVVVQALIWLNAANVAAALMAIAGGSAPCI